MKNTIVLISLFAACSSSAFGSCIELLPKGAEAPGFFDPRVYRCEGSVGGASSYSEGDRLGKQEALAQAANFKDIANCRQIGVDQTRRHRSFCHPMTFCTEFKTLLYFSCGPGEANALNAASAVPPRITCEDICAENQFGSLAYNRCVLDCRGRAH